MRKACAGLFHEIQNVHTAFLGDELDFQFLSGRKKDNMGNGAQFFAHQSFDLPPQGQRVADRHASWIDEKEVKVVWRSTVKSGSKYVCVNRGAVEKCAKHPNRGRA